jgi:sucrose-6-phosphate hydrolase SacC (GH32 family)
MRCPLFVAFVGCLLPGVARAASSAEPRDILATAVAVWHCADDSDSQGANSGLTAHGDVVLGVALEGQEATDSLARGGDGRIAELRNGWLDAGSGADHELDLTGDTFTALIRLRCLTGQWSTRGLYARGGNHDRLVFNFFSHDFGQGSAGMRVGCEVGVEGRPGLAGQVTALVPQIGHSDWHDLVARYDGAELVLFVDGVVMQRVPCSGPLRQGNTEPVAIGAGTNNGTTDAPFPGVIDHAALWKHALSDAEIIALSGGGEWAESQAAKFAAFTPQTPITELVAARRELNDRFQHDPHRPRYHFVCPEAGDNMPFDPNGMIYWQGRYHLFYIFQTTSPHIHHWGHASSIDLVHWTRHPTGLGFDSDDPDQGIFSGNAFVNLEGRPTILYHGVGTGNCLAVAEDDDLIHWRKLDSNPLVPIPREGEPDFGKYESWDPHGWVEGDTYYGIFGGARPALFRGTQLDEWDYVGDFISTDEQWDEPGEDISCPDFFRIGDRHMLLCISHRRGARYFLGEWDGERFVPDRHERMNWPGGGFFAPETLLDEQGRRILLAWVMDPRDTSRRIDAGWSGVMSLPRVLSLDDDGDVRIEPAEELERLRHRPVAVGSFQVAAGEVKTIPEISGDTLELEVEFSADSAHECGVVVRASPDGEEQTVIEYDREAGVLRIDFGRASLDSTITYHSWCIFRPDDAADAQRLVTIQEAPLQLASGEPLRLRIFVDRSMLEVFANGRQCITQRIFPTRADSTGVAVFSRGGPAAVSSLRSWTMAATVQD